MARSLVKQSVRAVRIAALVVGFQSRAAAEDALGRPARDRVRLEYRAPVECPDRAGFRVLVASRLPEGWEAAPDELAASFDVEVSAAENGYVATLEILDERGERVTRSVRGELCASVVDAIALVSALAIQSRATADRGQPERAPESTPTPAPLAVTAPKLPAPGRAAAAPRAARPARRASEQRAASAARDRQASHSPGQEATAFDLRVSARAALSTGVGPNVAPGAALGIVFEPRGARFGVALQAFRTARAVTEGAPVQFELLSARLEACPFVLVISDSISVEPCPFAEIGAVSGEAFERPPVVVRGERGTALWLSGGVTGRGVGRFGAFVVELEAVLGIPLRRERFYIEQRDELYRVPAYYGAVASGLGVQF